MKKTVKMLKGECWYAGVVNDGYRFPLDENSVYEFDFAKNDTFNQINPVLLSTHGRYVRADEGKFKTEGGVIGIEGKEITLGEEGNTLASAARAARKFYPPDGKTPDPIQYLAPQYCTWIALGENHSQAGVLDFARSLKAAGFPPGLIIIDDSWQRDYGDWRFTDAFPDPKAMFEELKSMGFKTSLWIVPYISENAPAFKKLYNGGAILRRGNEISYAKWWKATTPALDLKASAAVEWLTETLDGLRRDYGVDGFKFDGGDATFYGENTDGQRLSEIWATFYPSDIKELRACYKAGGKAITQRLADKAHEWKVVERRDEKGESYLSYGLESVIPNTLVQGLVGYPFGCPDMVGGGLMCDMDSVDKIDSELIIRSLEAEILMPSLQFSYPVWKMNERVTGKIKRLLAEREKILPYISELYENAAKTGEPIVRPLEYEFPHEGLEKITDCYMLGNKYLVCPILEKGEKGRKVILPRGRWKRNGTITDGGNEVYVESDGLIVFERI